MHRRAAAVAKMGPTSVRQSYGGHSRALATSRGIIDWGFYNTRSRGQEDGAQDPSKPTQQALSPALKSHIISKYGQEHAPAIIARIKEKHFWRERGGWKPSKRISTAKMQELRATHAAARTPLPQLAQQYGISVEAVRRILRSSRRQRPADKAEEEEGEEE